MKHPLLSTLVLSLATLAAAGCASMASGPVKTSGNMLTNPAGMTLYTFDNDKMGTGKSACNGPCAGIWPPVMADAGAMASGDMTVIARDDGTKQWAYKGKPVYTYKQDMKAGDMTGDNFRNVWHVAKP